MTTLAWPNGEVAAPSVPSAFATCSPARDQTTQVPVGVWAHSGGGTVRVSCREGKVIVDNPHSQRPPARFPLSDFARPTQLRYFGHTGALVGNVITWDNGVTWTKTSVPVVDGPPPHPAGWRGGG